MQCYSLASLFLASELYVLGEKISSVVDYLTVARINEERMPTRWSF